MSWLLKSLQSDVPDSSTSSPDHTPTNRSGGSVKEDLSVLGETIGRQLRGVAAFLAPPPSSPTSAAAADREEEEEEEEEEQEQPSDKLVGIRSDLAEIGGSFKSGLSLFSSNKAVTEISRFASSFLQFPNQDDHDHEGEDDDDGVPGITEEVVEFVQEISNRPEFWTDFPLPINKDFKMSEAQREHAENIEHVVPSLEALKVNLQQDMGDERFWMIYFILLLPRLNEHDFELLSTPEVVETRDALLQKLQNNKNTQIEKSNMDVSEESSKVTETKQENISSEAKVSELVNATKILEITSEENAEQWLEEGDISSESSVSAKKNPQEHEEDVSFSDLEDDDNYLSNRASMPKLSQHDKASSPSGSNDWVRLNKRPETSRGLQKPGQSKSPDKYSEGEESNEWITDDDFVNVASGN